ncbi:MAG: hypothetical protein B7Y98_07080 [Sphingomonas sp. 32-62-10]|nr:MAG: hypothetical protein B7Z43_08005 [Sphingomonas sp. 12-62-6]OYX38874.1 MAG: hypothetical protein B7Y98_07080 [Sphingomonas sp. 32-62-10]
MPRQCLTPRQLDPAYREFAKGMISGPAERERGMIDNFALLLSHGLMMLAAFLLLRRPDLDREPTNRPEDEPGA